ncbi:MAG: peptidyl-prolyl cis-trans isomerase [Candidatus Hydrothermae bacterium]|nr:peptidyl-prolyl cis-trans isomerase [Candidatus Hydrothermae bacterium]
MERKGLLLLTVVLMLTACKKEEKPQGKAIARVDGIYLLEEDLKVLQVPGLSWSEEDRSLLLDNWIRNTLLYLGAREEGLDQDPLLKRKLLWSERMLLAQEYLKRKSAGLTVTDEEIDSFLKDREELFKQGISIVIVFFSDSNRAPYIRKLLRRRGRRYRYAMEELRNQSDINVTELDSVNLGYFFLEFRSIPEVLKEKLRWMRKGQVSKVFSADGEYVIIKLLEKFPLVPQKSEVRSYIRQVLYERKRAALEDSLVEALRKKFKVEKISGGS